MSTTIGIYTFDRIETGSREKAIIGGFVEALYTANDELGDAPLSQRAQKGLEALAVRFCLDNVGILDVLARYRHDMECIGQLLYLSLDGHGTGLWDYEEYVCLDDWIEAIYRRETGRSIYSVGAYTGDDGLVYFDGLSIFQSGLAT